MIENLRLRFRIRYCAEISLGIKATYGNGTFTFTINIPSPYISLEVFMRHIEDLIGLGCL
jgi:hypothetical protein